MLFETAEEGKIKNQTGLSVFTKESEGESDAKVDGGQIDRSVE